MITKMKYTLVTKKGRIISFYIKELAEMYLEFEGGVLLTDDLLDEVDVSEVLKSLDIVNN